MARQMDATELDEFFHHIGAAIWHVQHLENVLVSLLALKISKEHQRAGQALTMANAEKLLAEKRKLTLGPLINSCVKYRIIRPQEQSRFANFKLERHWLVHRSLMESADDLYDNSAREAVFSRIVAIRDEAISLRAIVFGDLQNWADAEGVCREAVDMHAEEELRKLRGTLSIYPT